MSISLKKKIITVLAYSPFTIKIILENKKIKKKVREENCRIQRDDKTEDFDN